MEACTHSFKEIPSMRIVFSYASFCEHPSLELYMTTDPAKNVNVQKMNC